MDGSVLSELTQAGFPVAGADVRVRRTGTMCTIDPAARDPDHILIRAGGDRYRVDKPLLAITVRAPDGPLSDAEVLAVAELGRRAERCLRVPLVIDWAYDTSGRLRIRRAIPAVRERAGHGAG